MDRFSEESAADLFRNYRSHALADDESFSAEDMQEVETPYQPLCAAALKLTTFAACPTVRLYSEAMTKHKETCEFCRTGRKTAASEVSGEQRPGKVA